MEWCAPISRFFRVLTKFPVLRVLCWGPKSVLARSNFIAKRVVHCQCMVSVLNVIYSFNFAGDRYMYLNMLAGIGIHMSIPVSCIGVHYGLRTVVSLGGDTVMLSSYILLYS